MSLAQINPFDYFSDTNGDPLDAGFIYIGVANLDPKTNPINVFYDAALTIPVTQPVRTVNGYVLNAGQPAALYVNSDYSARVLNRLMSQVYYMPSAFAYGVDALLASPSGSANIGFLQAGAGAVMRTVQDKARDIVSLIDFTGADPTGTTPSDTAIDNWLAVLSTGAAITAPAGTFTFTSPKVIPALNNITIKGAGRQKTKFVYTGASTNIDLWTVGDGTTQFGGLDLGGFNIDSRTTMTGGHALHVKKCVGGNNIKDVSLSILNTTKKLWNGIRFSNTNVASYIGFEVNCQAEGVVVAGDALLDSASDLILDKGSIVGGTVGIHVGGGFGGLYVGDVLCYGQTGTGYRQDNALVARGNREVILSDRCVLDGANSTCLHINETVGNSSVFHCGAFITGAGFFTASPGDGVYIQSMPIGRVSITSAQIKSNKRHGINIADSTTNVVIAPQTLVTDNLGWGLYTTVALTLVKSYATYLYNTTGDIIGYVRDYLPFSTGVAPSTGTFTTASGSMRYRRFGSTVTFVAAINIAANGTGATSVTFSIPFSAKEFTVFQGRANVLSGKALSAWVNANSNICTVTNYDNSYPAASGEVLQITGNYEAY